MIFSLFGRKEARSPSRKRDAGSDAGNRPATGVVTGRATDQDQREIARLTAAKIDEIESQMIDGRPAGAAARPAAQASLAGAVFVPSGAGAAAWRADAAAAPAMPRAGAAQPMAAPISAAAAGSGAAPAVAGLDVPPPPPQMAPLDWTGVSSGSVSTSGDSTGMAIEVAASELLPLFEEAAVLFSNGQGAAAASVLWQEISNDTLGAQTRHGWAMLFDVYQATGRKEEFESLALRFSSRFETSPPTWEPALAPPVSDGRSQSTGPTVVAMPASLDAQAVRQIEQLQRTAQRNRSVMLDVSTVRSVDPLGADLLLRVLVAFRKAGRELVVVGAESLHALVAATIEAGRRDPTDACWLLQLELLRALERQQEFEDLAIDYCVTYEVSPPSWEPATTTVRSAASAADGSRPAAAGTPAFDTTPHGFMLRGEIEGRAQQVLDGLRSYMKERTDAVVDCRGLRRLDFVAAGELLNEVVALHAAGKYLVFKDVNHVVAALLVVMGIPALAEVRRRTA